MLRTAIAMLLVLVVCELVLRFAFKLGDPPIYELDEQIEYLLRPSQECHQLGNRYAINGFSMRSPEFPPAKSNPDEFRVLVMGDSIVNAGVRVDQRDLATELLRPKLESDMKRTVVVANASAGSWGPPNQLAYVKTFGVFHADVLVLVLNSPDIDDVPGLEGLGTQWPLTRPVLAVQDVLRTMGPKLLKKVGIDVTPSAAHTANPAQDQQTCLAAVRELTDIAHEEGVSIALVLYQTRTELLGTPMHGHEKFKALARELDIPVIDAGPKFKAALTAGQDPFIAGDDVHSNPLGQRILADVLAEAVAAAQQPASK